MKAAFPFISQLFYFHVKFILVFKMSPFSHLRCKDIINFDIRKVDNANFFQLY